MSNATTTGLLRHFLQFSDFSRDEVLHVFERAKLIKDKFKRYEPHRPLHDRTLAMVFEKASTRTRVSFEAGMYQMGGSVIHLTTSDSQLGRSEPIEDTARVISRMVDIVMIRTFEQTRIERFAEYSRVPVINGLTNEFHPCQILADIFTFIENRGSIADKTVAWVGDANNMAYTWLYAACLYASRLPSRSQPNRRHSRRHTKRVQRSARSLQGCAPRDDRRMDQHGL
jgi:ornithine carbamoyltransferase